MSDDQIIEIEEIVLQDKFKIVEENLEMTKKYNEIPVNEIPTISGPFIIFVNFDKHAVEVEFEIQATGSRDKILATNGELRLMHGRFYLLPIKIKSSKDNEFIEDYKFIDSDNFYIKLFSDISAMIDVRFVKDGFACVMPLRHNVTIKDNQRLCVIA